VRGNAVRKLAEAVGRWPPRRRHPAHRRSPAPEVRITARGQRIDVALLRAFLKRALEDDAVVEEVNDLLFDHILAAVPIDRAGVAQRLPILIPELVAAASPEDWRAVADELIAEAREVVG
jgi:hypothetical protein